MPVMVMGLAAMLAGVTVWLAVRRWPVLDPASPVVAAHAPAEVVREHPALRRFVRDRLAPGPATGLALTVSVAVISVAAVAFAIALALVRRQAGADGIDVDIAQWAATSATDASTLVLKLVTEAGGTRLLLPLGILVAALEYRRLPSRAMVAFLALVMVGQNLLSNGLKWVVDRVRPDIDPLAGFSGPSFPSGHTTAAAACFAAFALVLGRRRSLPVKAALAGGAAAVAVGVGATRVMLGVHWFTDVVAGLALGWAWFMVGSIAFGGRLLRFGAPLEAATRTPPVEDPVEERAEVPPATAQRA